MTYVYEICIEHGYLGMGYYGDRISGILCRPISLPDDYSRLGETVFFFEEDAAANVLVVQERINECNEKRWKDNPTPIGLHGLGFAGHSHSLGHTHILGHTP